MCGIFGLIGRPPEKHFKMLFFLLRNIFIHSQVRGKDASGFSCVHLEDNQFTVERRPIDSYKFVKRSKKFASLEYKLPEIFIGHTRYATSGDPKFDRNNHPFVSDKYALVHNGVIEKWADFVKTHELTLRSHTDSEIILRLLESKETTEEALKFLEDNSAYGTSVATAIIDRVKNTLSIFRNGDRPLSILNIRKSNVIIFASTEDIIQQAIKSTFAKNAQEYMDNFDMRIGEFPEYTLGEYRLEGNSIVFEHKKIPKTIKYTPRTIEDVMRKRSAPLTDIASLATRAAKISKLMMTNTFITKEEIADWKKWRNKIC